MEEIEKIEEIEKCSLCGMCKTSCPVFRVLLTETSGPRGKAALIKKNLPDQIFYRCTLCKACTVACPADVKLDEEIIKVREKLVENKWETEVNKRMIKNIREFGNPFKKPGEKGGVKIKDLNCC